MKLLRAHIENFRLLKELELEFSSDSKKNLTVIRAANESGKTTMLSALQWGMFGDDGLPDRGKNYRLSPIDISDGDKVSVTPTVEIDFEITTRTGARQYRLIRFVTESVKGGEFQRGPANVNLFDLTKKGADTISNAEAHIRPHLPKELREVFFTDGDRALSFIEGNKGDQMKRVEGAIRSLLGLGVVEEAISHTASVGKALNKKVKSEAGNRAELESAAEKLIALQEEIPDLKKDLGSAREERIRLEDLELEADKKLSDALRRGNREELEKQRKDARQGKERAQKDSDQATRDHANLFKSETLGKQLLASVFGEAKHILDALHQEGKIPNQTIPVLEDRLRQPNCICGEPLDEASQDGKKRREHIKHLIEDSRNSDEIQKKVTELYYSAQDLLNPNINRSWVDEYSDVFERRQRANKSRLDFGERESSIETKIGELPDVDIQQLREARNHYREQRDKARDKEMRLSALLDSKQHELKNAENEQGKLLQQDERGHKFISELEVAKDLQDILINALEAMKTRELKQVSDKMNELFLDMIGSDSSQRSIITKAEITPDFRIIVSGRYGHPLDPSQDLNGASRRALTIAFILALTRVSEVEAPNVIDTPLGMMSGYVKQSVLRRASEESAQLILFLTHSEINGCEDILDEKAGRVYTITNPAHYPKILVNDPGIEDTRVLLCKCNHRQHCEICERRENISVVEKIAVAG